MPPRQRMPLQGGMNPIMMRQQRGMGISPFGFQRPFTGNPQSPMMGFPPPQFMFGPQRQMNRGGGLLSKILGKGNQPGLMGGAGAANRAGEASGSLLKTLSNPASINGLLNNTQQMIKTAQSIGPMVQQYGPLVKNLPAIWKLYRGLKDTSTETDSEAKNPKEEAGIEDDSKIPAKKDSSSKEGLKPKKTSKKTKQKSLKGSSIPKMYI